MRELTAITRHYGTRCAKRSGVPLLNHITEGLRILAEIKASPLAMRAYCLHPLVQEDKDLEENFWTLYEFDTRAVALAMEYRSVANAYLSQAPVVPTDEIRLSPLKHVNDMLIADKVQNYKDFLIHHLGKHERSSELNRYFQQWLDRLGVTPEEFAAFEDLLAT